MSEEIWKDIKGYEGWYMVSSCGRVKSLCRIVDRTNKYGTTHKKLIRERIMRDSPCGHGYRKVTLSKGGVKKYINVHSLVYSTFRGSYKKPLQVDHINNVKTDNRLENLQLLSNRANVTKAWDLLPTSSAYTGVTAVAGRFDANIKINGKRQYLGRFKDEKQAHAAYINKLKRIL